MRRSEDRDLAEPRRLGELVLDQSGTVPGDLVEVGLQRGPGAIVELVVGGTGLQQRPDLGPDQLLHGWGRRDSPDWQVGVGAGQRACGAQRLHGHHLGLVWTGGLSTTEGAWACGAGSAVRCGGWAAARGGSAAGGGTGG